MNVPPFIPPKILRICIILHYRGGIIEMTFQIGGINCSGCTTNIEKKVTERYGESGLLEVVATFLTNKLCVVIKQEAQRFITPEAIEELVRDMGKT
jgi:copper chaperone CopZ